MIAKDVIQHPSLPHGNPLRPGIVVLRYYCSLLLIVRAHVIGGYPIHCPLDLLTVSIVGERGNDRAVLLDLPQPVLGIVLQIVGVATDLTAGLVAIKIIFKCISIRARRDRMRMILVLVTISVGHPALVVQVAC